MAADDKPSIANFSGILTVLLLVVGAVWVQGPLDTNRPAAGSGGARLVGVQDVDARLWQDPFGVVNRALHGKSAQKDAKAVSKTGRPPALTAQPHTPKSLQQQISRNLQIRPDGVIVLGVMVHGGPSVGSEEYRRRTRYAVLSALMSNGYQPLDAEHIGFVNGSDLECAYPQFVPYEWLHGEGVRPALVLWLDESALAQEPSKKDAALRGRPLARLARLLETLVGTKANGSVQFDIVGPASSGMLLAMADELGEYNRSDSTQAPRLLPKLGFYSPFATISDDRVRASYFAIEESVLAEAESCLPQNDACRVDQLFAGNAKHRVRTFVRAQASDEAVIALLFDELHQRGVAEGSHIAIVGEMDTEYARRLAKEVEFAHAIGRVHKFNYMRGVDGKLGDADKAEGDSKKAGDKARDGGQVERPEGDQQIDYIRRLRDAMKQRESWLTERANSKRAWSPFMQKVSFKAIGVIGNDYYDKLLVLQALRPVFPDAVFFTTDAYAAMLHPVDNKAMRNVVVGSGFGLSLNPGLQNGTPPFRDSYQSAAYMAVRLALAAAHGQDLAEAPAQAWLQPVAWEVGRTRLFALRPQMHPLPCEDGELNCPHDLRHARAGPALSGVLLVALGALVVSLVVSRRLRQLAGTAVRRWWFYVLVLPAAGLVVSLLIIPAFNEAMRWSGEPFAWFEGVSVWPSNLLRGAALLVAVGGLVYAYCSVSQRIAETGGKFFPVDHSSAVPPADHANPCCAWNAYRRSMRLGRVGGRAAVELACIFALFMTVSRVTGSVPYTPTRSPDAHLLNFAIVMASVLMTWYLLACIVVAVRHTSDLTRNLSRRTAWPDAMRQQYGLPDSTRSTQFDDWLDLQVIARQTEAVNRLVYFPFLALLLLVVARSDIFDNWSVPPELVIVLGFSFLYLIAAAVQLRHTAEKARINAQRALERKRIMLQGRDSPDDKVLATQCGTLIEGIQKLNRGAFLPFTQQSMARAFLALVGGISGAKLLEYAAMANF